MTKKAYTTHSMEMTMTYEFNPRDHEYELSGPFVVFAENEEEAKELLCRKAEDWDLDSENREGTYLVDVDLDVLDVYEAESTKLHKHLLRELVDVNGTMERLDRKKQTLLAQLENTYSLEGGVA